MRLRTHASSYGQSDYLSRSCAAAATVRRSKEQPSLSVTTRMTDPESPTCVRRLSVAATTRRLHHIYTALRQCRQATRATKRSSPRREIPRLDDDKRFGVERGSSGHDPTQTSFVILIRFPVGRPANRLFRENIEFRSVRFWFSIGCLGVYIISERQ